MLAVMSAIMMLWLRVQGLLEKCLQQTEFKTMPSQILCLAGALTFTQQAEQAIANGALAQLQVP